MLLIHWSKHNKANLIAQNGIRPSSKSFSTGEIRIKGIWCFPYSRNKTLNTRWKSVLKKDKGTSNYNGFVFKLETADFPIYAGDLAAIRFSPKTRIFETYEDFSEKYGHYFSPKALSMEYNEQNDQTGIPDYFDFEVILTKPIASNRIIKIIKDNSLHK